ncbi:MAG: peptide/nickel transport system substrate-binding protein [Saprospiraceae bacterium]|jgi:peptide/nickel transport system substrate-binding protein
MPMKKINLLKPSILLLILFALSSSCKQEKVSTDIQDELVVRLESSPVTMSPILSKIARDGEVNEFMFVSLGDHDPLSLELIPVLVREIPRAEKIEKGKYAGGDGFTLQMKEGASWNDGSPITGRDVLFTYKMAAHPDVLTPDWKNLLEDIYDVKVDEQDPSKFTILTSGRYFLNLEAILSAEIYPQYLYEGSSAIDAISLNDLKEITSQELEAQQPNISQLGKDFSSAKYSKEVVEGAGPYELSEWSPDEYIVLSKKRNFWGDKYPNNLYLQGHFDKIVFQIIPDETVALTLLKNDEIDVLRLSKSPFVVFKGLRDASDDDIETYSSNSVYNNMILLNNQGKILKDRKVREALVAITDVDRIMNQLEGGTGIRINSIINPNKPAYKKSLAMAAYDLEKARAILDDAGWKDTNGDQIRDKIVDGVKEELSLEFLITASSTSEGISSVLVQSAKEVGVEIKPLIKKFSEIQNEYLRTGNYDLSVMRRGSSISSDDPYSAWHSSRIGIEGLNYVGYSNPLADKEMEKIQELNITQSERMKAYHDLQNIMAADFPVIFLYSPQGKYAIDDDIEPLISFKRPGIFVNAFKMK